MQKGSIILFILLSIIFGNQQTDAQVSSASNFLIAQAVPDRTIYYSVADTGEYKPIIWGLDLAWLSRDNIRRGIAFMGIDRVDLIRSSFTPTAPLVNGELQATELGRLNERLNIIDLLGSQTKVVLNCDHPSVDPWFKGNAKHWAELIEVTAKHHESRGRTVVTVSPFNEPDYSATGQGTVNDFYNIAAELKQHPYFNNIRISGGNTLNTDQALNWYNPLKEHLDEGNTHQLAGSFDHYAEFFETVRSNGDHATNDELHNVMEAMVGVESGLQSGIWWGTAELARGEFVKASDGKRLGYAEHRNNWTAASVYRGPDGKVQAFGGTSERQAVTSTYRFVSTDKDVFYDGYGPQREYIMMLPGGTGYQRGQTNAERVVNINWGDDIQPVINGKYLLVNRKSGKVLEVAGGSTARGANLQQNSHTGANYQQWKVTPVDSRIGGDFSYFTFTAVHSAKAIDILNWSLDNGGSIIVWDDAKGANQQWYLDYAEDGWFYIRSRHSALCLDVSNGSTANAAKVVQWEKNGGKNQQWRFLPVGAPVEFDAPSKPANLSATENAVSIRLDWTASPETDVTSYTVFRAESSGGPYSTIARGVNTTSFADNTCTNGIPYFYVVKAMDFSLNHSDYSNEVSAASTGEKSMVAQYRFEENLLDSSMNFNHSAPFGKVSFVDGISGKHALALDGDENFLQLPATLANHQEMSVATWVNWTDGATWQRIFDFGNNENQYLFLSPRMRFAIKNGDTEQRLDASALPKNEWVHVAVTLGSSVARMYVNGEVVDESENITISPADFKPILNYIGRGQYPVPMFNGFLDDFCIYNYALTADEVAKLSDATTGIDHIYKANSGRLNLWPNPANDLIQVNYSAANMNNLSTLALYNANGLLILSQQVNPSATTELNIAHLPSGIYLLKLSNNQETITKKLMVKHD